MLSRKEAGSEFLGKQIRKKIEEEQRVPARGQHALPGGGGGGSGGPTCSWPWDAAVRLQGPEWGCARCVLDMTAARQPTHTQAQPSHPCPSPVACHAQHRAGSLRPCSPAPSRTCRLQHSSPRSSSDLPLACERSPCCPRATRHPVHAACCVPRSSQGPQRQSAPRYVWLGCRAQARCFAALCSCPEATHVRTHPHAHSSLLTFLVPGPGARCVQARGARCAVGGQPSARRSSPGGWPPAGGRVEDLAGRLWLAAPQRPEPCKHGAGPAVRFSEM